MSTVSGCSMSFFFFRFCCFLFSVFVFLFWVSVWTKKSRVICIMCYSSNFRTHIISPSFYNVFHYKFWFSFVFTILWRFKLNVNGDGLFIIYVMYEYWCVKTKDLLLKAQWGGWTEGSNQICITVFHCNITRDQDVRIIYTLSFVCLTIALGMKQFR